MIGDVGRKYKIRNVGVDLLRIIAMLFVVINHIFTHGGLINSVNGNLKYSISWLMLILVLPAVNIYIT